MDSAEPDNWYRGIHEGGHAVTIWALGGTVKRIEAGATHHDGLNVRGGPSSPRREW